MKFKIQNSKFKINEGFTLIELLVVMAIIGVLSTLLMVNFIGIRQRARDGDRKSNIRHIQAALELYRADQGAYPTESSAPYYLQGDAGNNPCTSTVSLVVSTSIYMKRIPCDPSGTSWFNNGNYYYHSSGTTYTLAACLENTSDNAPETTNVDPSPASGSTCSTDTYFIVNNP